MSSPIQTVFVLGAGASYEVDLPVGDRLKDLIADALNFRLERGEVKGGESKIVDALRFHAHSDIRPFLNAAAFIRGAMPQAPSIDNFIHAHRGVNEIELCGKLAIARCILQAEASSTLFVPRGREQFDFSDCSKAWFNRFWSVLVTTCDLDDLAKRLRSIAVISFNYDRCFEHYLYHAIQNYFLVEASDAAALTSLVTIFHPYGAVGSLPWQKEGNNPIPFGGDEIEGRTLLDIAYRIKTFTEGTDPNSSEIVELRETLADAETVFFLGFAYHPLNLELLWPKPLNTRSSVCSYGTALDLSEHDIEVIKRDLAQRSGAGTIVLSKETCCSMFHTFNRFIHSRICRA